MIGEKKLKEIAKQILSFSNADQTEVVISTIDHALTRYANSFIHQNVRCSNTTIFIRVVIKKRIGVVSTNILSIPALREAVKKAVLIARLSPEDPNFISLPKPKPIKRVNSFAENTVNFGSIDRARSVKKVIDIAKKAKLVASGIFETIISELAVVNSLGVWAYQPTTQAVLTAIVLGTDSTGYASQVDIDVHKINPETVARTATQKAVLGEHPIEITPGDYEVILEPPAVAEMMDFFASLGPNGRIFHEQASYLRNKMGKRVFSSKLTIWDDPFNAGTIPLAFDFEGYPKQKTLLVRAGVPKAIVYDSYLANKYKQRNTGHALPAPNTEGPIPGNLIITPGKKTSEQLIKGVKKGLLITRFWYVRMLHHYQMNITGMTRDGTFLIVNGKIVYGVKNLRFTQSIPEVLRNIVELSRESSIQLSWVGAGYYPFLFIKKFHFTSTTQF
jgi:predicted Zn-dependent protease